MRVHAYRIDGESKANGPALDLAVDSPEALMEAFLNGEPSAFERLFRRLSPRVAAALAHMSGDPRLAEDLTQIVFLKLFRSRAAYQRGMLVMPWVLAIARNTFLDDRRQRRRRPESLSSDGTLPEQVSEALEPGARKAMADLLQTLPAFQREALVLLKVEGLSLAEVASLCGTSTASIKMRLQRAYRSLRATLLDRTSSATVASAGSEEDPQRVRERRRR